MAENVEDRVNGLRMHQYVQTAAALLQKGADRDHADGALELLTRNLGIKYGESGLEEGEGSFYDHVKGLRDAMVVSDPARAAVIKTYLPRFSETFEKTTLGEYLTYLMDTKGDFKLSDYLNPNQLKVLNAKLEPYQNFVMGNIEELLKKRLLKKPEGEITNAQIRIANTNELIYEEVVSIINSLGEMVQEGLMVNAVNRGNTVKAPNIVKGKLEKFLGK